MNLEKLLLWLCIILVACEFLWFAFFDVRPGMLSVLFAVISSGAIAWFACMLLRLEAKRKKFKKGRYQMR